MNNAAALTALSVAGLLVGAIAFVGVPGATTPSFGAYFTLESSTGQSTDGVTIIASSSGSFVWVRSLSGVTQIAINQASWFIDTTSGNDENTGLTNITAVKTFAEIVRRMGTNNPTIIQNTTFQFLSAHPSPVIFNPTIIGVQVTLEGVLPAATQTGTLASVIAKNRATPQLLTATLGAGLSTGMMIVNATRGNSRAFLYRNTSGNVWQITQPLVPSAVPTPIGTSPAQVNTWANGDTYNIYSLIPVNLVSIRPNLAQLNGSFSNNLTIYQLEGNDPGTGSCLQLSCFAQCTETYQQKWCQWTLTEIPVTNAFNVNNAMVSASVEPGAFGASFMAGFIGTYGGSISQFSGGAGTLDGDIIMAGEGAYIFNAAQEINLLGLVYLESNTAGPHQILGGSPLAIAPGFYGSANLWGPGNLQVLRGALLVSGTPTATLTITGTLQVEASSTAYSNATAAGVVTTHGGITVSAANLAAAAGASGFGGLAYIPGVAAITTGATP